MARRAASGCGFVLLSALALAASGPGSALAGRPPTAATYRAQANAVCASEARRLNALPRGATLPVYLAEAIKIARATFKTLTQVTPPPELVRLNAEVIANIRAGFPIISTLLARAKAGRLTVAQFESNAALSRNVAREDSLWKKLGVAVCAKG